MLTQETLKSKLSYNPGTGIFTWIVNKRSVRKKLEAGCQTTNGYITIRINRKMYLAHRLAFLYMTGAFPTNQVDHINRVRNDNRFINLREVLPSDNSKNRSPKRHLPLGVYEIKRKGRKGIWYSVKIQSDYKTYSSSFRSLDDAIKWRKNKENELFRKDI